MPLFVHFYNNFIGILRERERKKKHIKPNINDTYLLFTLILNTLKLNLDSLHIILVY